MNSKIITKSFSVFGINRSVKKGGTDVTLIYISKSESLSMRAFNTVRNNFNSKPVTYLKATDYKKAFELLQSSEVAHSILSKPPNSLKSDDLIDAMRAFEMYLISFKIAKHTRSKSSRRIKSALENCSVELLDGRTPQEALKQFKSKFSKNGGLKSPESALLGNISTIEHVNIKSLEEQALSNISNSLGLIEAECGNSISGYLDIVEQHKKLKSLFLKPEIESYFDYRLTTTSPWNLKYFETLKYTEKDLMTYVLTSIATGKMIKTSPLPGLLVLPVTLGNKALWLNENSYRSYFFAEYHLPNHILVSIAVLICLKTGWNKSSVQDLLISGVSKISSSRYQLQSMKTKTDDETPIYEVVKSRDLLLFKSIELLLWHHRQLKKMYQTNEERIFISLYKNKCTMFLPLQTTNLNNNFVQIYNVPKFTASDLRPSRAGLTMLTTKDIQAVRELLGHNSISTTAEYLNNSLFFKLNEARVLEFQRRIDATITFIDGGDSLVSDRGLKGQHVDDNLIATESVGDGSRCKNPYDSPDPDTKRGELCGGLHCHVNEGCKNNVINVGLDDIELALRTRKYYQARWMELYEKNSKSFAQLHVPKIVFLHVLLAYTKQTQPNLLKSFNEEGIKC